MDTSCDTCQHLVAKCKCRCVCGMRKCPHKNMCLNMARNIPSDKMEDEMAFFLYDFCEMLSRNGIVVGDKCTITIANFGEPVEVPFICGLWQFTRECWSFLFMKKELVIDPRYLLEYFFYLVSENGECIKTMSPSRRLDF